MSAIDVAEDLRWFSDLSSGLLAGRYALGPRLGSAGPVWVYEAYDEMLDRGVAVKVLRPEASADIVARHGFLSEARAAAGIDHPHVVRIHDIASSSRQPFVVMEQVGGASLVDAVAAGVDVPEHQAVAVASQVLAALEAVHRAGVVHGDVTPANILLPDRVVPQWPDQTPGIKLAEIGAATGAPPGVRRMSQQLSPEQVLGRPPTPRSDLYATAAVLYELLAGRPPFQAGSMPALLRAHREQVPARLDRLRPDLDPGLVTLVHRALATDPAARPAAAPEMRRDLLGRGAPVVVTAGAVVGPGTAWEAAPPTRAPASPTRASASRPRARARRRGVAGGRGRAPASRWAGIGMLAGVLALLVAVLVSGVPGAATAGQRADRRTATGAGAVQPEEGTRVVVRASADASASAARLQELLDTPAEIAGPRSDELRNRVQRILLAPEGSWRRDRGPVALREDVARWIARGRLDARFADEVLRLLDRVLEPDV